MSWITRGLVGAVTRPPPHLDPEAHRPVSRSLKTTGVFATRSGDEAMRARLFLVGGIAAAGLAAIGGPAGTASESASAGRSPNSKPRAST